MATKTIHVITWNVNGLKRNRDDKFQKLQNADVVFFQETHIGEGDEHIIEGLKNEWHVFYTKYTSCTKGTAILVRKSLDFECISDQNDSHGAYVVLKCRLEGQLYTLVSVYNHEKDTKTLERLSAYLQSETKGLLVIGGDFNTVLNPFIDKDNSKEVTDSTSHKTLRSCVNKFMKSLQLMDIWRRKNPVIQDYTYHNRVASRLDYFFVPEECMWRVRSCEIKHSNKRDHCPVHLEINNTSTTLSQKDRQIQSVFQWLNLKKDLFTDETVSSLVKESSHAVSEVDILSAVNSLQVSDTPRPDGIPVSFYKENMRELIPYIKALYDRIHSGALNCSEKHFNETVKSPHDDSQHFFNVDYLIIATILTKRLDDFLESQAKGRVTSASVMITPKTFCTEMRLSCIKDKIEEQKRSNPTLYQDFLIVKNLLRDAPEVDTESVDFSIERDKLLDQGCPLTPVLITLALKCFASALAGPLKQNDILVFKESVILCIQPEDLEEVIGAVRTRDNEVYYIKELSKDGRLNMYAVVTLQDSDEVMVAPLHWLSLDKKQCFWPPFKSTEKCMEAVQKRLEPETGGKKWEKLNISFHKEYDSFDKAKEGQKEIAEQKQRSLLPTEFAGMLKRQRFENAQELSKKTLPTPSTSRMTANDKGNLLHMLRNIKSMVQENSTMLKKLLKENTVSEAPSSTSFPTKEYKTGLNLPLRTFEDVSRTELQLTNGTTRQKYVKVLSKLGGIGPKDVIRNIMQKVLTDDLAKEFNWQGRGDKKAFSKLNLADVIRDAASKQRVMMVDSENEIKNYLRYSADRIGRKRPRVCGGVTSEVNSLSLLDSAFQSDVGMSFNLDF